MLKTPSEIPEHLKTFFSIKARVFCKQLEAHNRFNSEQEWFLTAKTMGKPARCSSCLKPRAIKIADLHLRVKGLLCLGRDNRVVETNLRVRDDRVVDLGRDNSVVETNLRFCLNNSCCLNIESSRNNIQSLKSLMIKKYLLLGTLSQEEIITVQLEGFKIQRIPNVEL